MRAEGDVTQISWREPSVRGFARDKVGLAFTAVLSLHLLGGGEQLLARLSETGRKEK